MRVLVTGGAGFIGSHVVDALQLAGHDVFAIDDFSTGRIENIQTHAYGNKSGSKFQNGSILNTEMLESNFAEFRPEVVIHLAAQAAISTSLQHPKFDLQVNALGTLNILEMATIYDAKRVIFASTSAVYLDAQLSLIGCIKENWPVGPNNPYGISKLAAEGYVRTLFQNSVILRFGNVIGERQVPIGENQVLSRMIRHFKYGDEFYIHGSGNQKRDFVHVSDVVRAVIAALDGLPGTYNIATGEAHSVSEIAKIVEERYGVPGYKWEHIGEEDPRAHICLDVSLAKEGLNWQPKVKLEQAVNRTIDWWESL